MRASEIENAGNLSGTAEFSGFFDLNIEEYYDLQKLFWSFTKKAEFL
jgi:hypothetical protein